MHFHMGNHLWATIFVHAGCRGFPPLSISKAFILPKKNMNQEPETSPSNSASWCLICTYQPTLRPRSRSKTIGVVQSQNYQPTRNARNAFNQTWPFSNPPWKSMESVPWFWWVWYIGTPKLDRCHRDVPGGPFSTGFSETSETFTSSHLRHPSRVEFTAVETCGNIRGNHQQWLVFCVCWICIWYVCVCFITVYKIYPTEGICTM